MRMKNISVMWMAIILLMMSGSVPFPVLADDMMVIGHDDVFGTLSRPVVAFPHDLHIDALEDEGCGACHHSWDNAAEALVYIEGEEMNCYECHLLEKAENIPALREAYHGSCNACHRELIKVGQLPSGPTTCGECHIKPE